MGYQSVGLPVEELLSMSKTLTTNEVIEDLLAGEMRRVFDALYKTCWPKVLKYIEKNSGDREEAQDIFHDALLILIRQVKSGKYRSEYEVDGYVYVIARNLWINRVKRLKRQTEIEGEEMESDIDLESDMITNERRRYVLKMLSNLGERCRELLELTIFHNYTMLEVKDKMGFASADVAKTKHYKCKQRLIDMVKDNKGLKDYLKNG